MLLEAAVAKCRVGLLGGKAAVDQPGHIGRVIWDRFLSQQLQASKVTDHELVTSSSLRRALLSTHCAWFWLVAHDGDVPLKPLGDSAHLRAAIHAGFDACMCTSQQPVISSCCRSFAALNTCFKLKAYHNGQE